MNKTHISIQHFQSLLYILFVFVPGFSQNDSYSIVVDLNKPVQEVEYEWAYFGHDEANWATTAEGMQLLDDISKSSPVRVTFRAHHLFTSGDPETTRLKWSPTDVYHEDENGNPVYNWTNVDKILDTYLKYNIRPMIELGFMPQDLSTKTEPYEYEFKGPHIKNMGWVYPPEDYEKWGMLVEEFTKHVLKRYGYEEVDQWIWEVWNEPDIFFWQGTKEEYFKLYDYAIHAVRKVLPDAFVGGPATTAPKAEKSAVFLREFLNHCFEGTNYVTGETGSPLDFISFHTKGAPEMIDGHVRMGLKRQMSRADWAYSIIAEFPQAKELPVYITESDPEGTAAYNVADRPENIFRQGAIYPVYNVVTFKKLRENAAMYNLDMKCNLTWAFTFPGSEYFAGFRELATNGINKAVLNGFRLLGMLRGQEVSVTSSGDVGVESILAKGIQDNPYIDALASIDNTGLTVLVWNYHDDNVEVEPSQVRLEINGLPNNKRLFVTHYRVDEDHGNPYRLWLEMGSPQTMTDEQIQLLKKESELPLYDSPIYIDSKEGNKDFELILPRYSLSLIRMEW